MTYRYYSIGWRDGAWRILGWSRTEQAAAARRGTRYWAHAGTRAQAARILRDRHGITVVT